MPKKLNLREVANNSTCNSTPCGATSAIKTISIEIFDARELLEISSTLNGEEAIEQAIRFFDYPKDESTGELMLKNVMRFYSNARYLTETIHRLFEQEVKKLSENQ